MSDADYVKNPCSYGTFLEEKMDKVATLDFSSERKSMSTVIKGFKPNSNTLLLKGATERVIDNCTSYKLADGTVKEFKGQDKANLQQTIKKFELQGLRVLGLAINYDGGKLKSLTKENAQDMLSDFSKYQSLESGGTFIGCMCIKDPVRPEVKNAIEDCKTAGIRVIMITGDSQNTATAIAKELLIIDPTSNDPNDSFEGKRFVALDNAQKKMAL